MRRVLAVSALLLALGAAGCASMYHNASEREWARAECRNIIDGDARTKCLERADKD